MANNNFQVHNGITVGNVIIDAASGNISGINSLSFGSGSGNTVYDLDDMSSSTDGFTNEFPLTYNQNSVTISSPWNLLVTVDGLTQPAFSWPPDVTSASYILTAQKGYTIDPQSGNLKFADPVYQGAQIMARTVFGNPNGTPKKYPLKPLDIMMAIGY
jgi:hypothetical protein